MQEAPYIVEFKISILFEEAYLGSYLILDFFTPLEIIEIYLTSRPAYRLCTYSYHRPSVAEMKQVGCLNQGLGTPTQLPNDGRVNPLQMTHRLLHLGKPSY
jgi:hypothetical protein